MLSCQPWIWSVCQPATLHMLFCFLYLSRPSVRSLPDLAGSCTAALEMYIFINHIIQCWKPAVPGPGTSKPSSSDCVGAAAFWIHCNQTTLNLPPPLRAISVCGIKLAERQKTSGRYAPSIFPPHRVSRGFLCAAAVLKSVCHTRARRAGRLHAGAAADTVWLDLWRLLSAASASSAQLVGDTKEMVWFECCCSESTERIVPIRCC